MSVPNTNVVVPVTGPADFFVQLGADADPTQLGYSAEGPQIDFSPMFVEVPSDRFGGMSANRLFQGEKAMVAATLTEFDWVLYERMKQIPAHSAAANIAATTSGRLDRLAIGAATAGAIRLWVRFQFYGTAYASTGLPPGYYFYSVNLTPQSLNAGSKGGRLTLAWDAFPIYDPATCKLNTYSTAAALFAGLPAPCTPS
jgi:hypothetical protein